MIRGATLINQYQRKSLYPVVMLSFYRWHHNPHIRQDKLDKWNPDVRVKEFKWKKYYLECKL